MPPETPTNPEAPVPAPTNQPVVVTQSGARGPRSVKRWLWALLAIVVLAAVLAVAGHFWANAAASTYQTNAQKQGLAKAKASLAKLSFAPLVTKQQADDQNYVPETTACDAYKAVQTTLSAAHLATLANVPLGSLLSGAYAKAQTDARAAQNTYTTLTSLVSREVTACSFYVQDMKLSDALTNADQATTTVLDPPGFSFVVVQDATTGIRYACPATKACLTPHSLTAFTTKWAEYATAVANYQALFANHACYFAELTKYCTQAAAAKAQEVTLIQAVTTTLTVSGVTQGGTGSTAYDTAHQALLAHIASTDTNLASTLHSIDAKAPSNAFEDALLTALQDQFAATEAKITSTVR